MKVGVIGAGAISRRAHLPVLKGFPSLKVAALADVDETRLEQVGDEFDIGDRFRNYTQILKDSSVDIIDVCVPTPLHHRVVKEALHAGKHVLVEKPLAMSLDEALDLWRAAKASAKKVCVVQNYRYFPSVTKMRSRLKAGRLGKIVTMHGKALSLYPNVWTRSQWLYHEKGALYDFAPHLIDLILWTSGSPVQSVFARGGDFTGGQMGFINYVQIMLQFADRSVVTADISWLTGCLIFTLDIHGTGGHFLVNVMRDLYQEVHGSMGGPLEDAKAFGARMWTLLKDLRSGRFFNRTLLSYRPLISEFVGSIEYDSFPPVSIEEGVRVNLVLEAVEESLSLGQAVEIRGLLEKRGMTEGSIDEIWRGSRLKS